MSQRIVIEIPDNAPERLYGELVVAVSTVAQAIGNVASPSFRVEVHHDAGGQDSVVRRPDPSVPHRVLEPPDGFTVVLRGYDRMQVEDWAGRVRRSAPPYPMPSFRVVFRGYDRVEVDRWVRHVTGVQ